MQSTFTADALERATRGPDDLAYWLSHALDAVVRAAQGRPAVSRRLDLDECRSLVDRLDAVRERLRGAFPDARDRRRVAEGLAAAQTILARMAAQKPADADLIARAKIGRNVAHSASLAQEIESRARARHGEAVAALLAQARRAAA